MLDEAKQKLARAYKKYPFMVERARPFFDLREQSLEAKGIMYDVSGKHRHEVRRIVTCKAVLAFPHFLIPALAVKRRKLKFASIFL